jgi:hypothetical protein
MLTMLPPAGPKCLTAFLAREKRSQHVDVELPVEMGFADAPATAGRHRAAHCLQEERDVGVGQAQSELPGYDPELVGSVLYPPPGVRHP